MADSNLPKNRPGADAINISKLNFFDAVHIKDFQEKNLERVKKLLKDRRNNRLTAAALSLGVIGIYGYTIFAMKQETFLDDFNEPEKIHD